MKCCTATRSNHKTILRASEAVKKELLEAPVDIRERFITNLALLSIGKELVLEAKKLKSIGDKVFELKINGSPAWRLVYTVYENNIFILCLRKKTAQGKDKALISLAKKRLKLL